MKLTTKFLMATTLYALASVAHAAATYCSASDPNDDGLSTSNMTFNTNNSNDCFGVVEKDVTVIDGVTSDGNDTVADINAIWGGDPWQFLAKDDAPGSGTDTGTIDGVKFTLAADAGSSGDWTLGWEDVTPPGAGLSITLDIAGVLKSQSAYATYLFEGLTFDVSPSSGAGTFTIAFCVQGECNNLPNLSHLSLYARLAVPPPPPPPAGVPEPSILALFGIGMVGMGLTRRRRIARLNG